VFTETDEVFGSRRRSSHRFREYLVDRKLKEMMADNFKGFYAENKKEAK